MSLADARAPASASAASVNPNEVASLFTAQLAAALQFEMEEVFGMTDEGLRGRLLMLQHAKAQGFAPINAEKLIMFLNLELQERAAGRVIEQCALEASRVPAAAPCKPGALEGTAPKQAAVKPAPAFSTGHSSGSSTVALRGSSPASSTASRASTSVPPVGRSSSAGHQSVVLSPNLRAPPLSLSSLSPVFPLSHSLCSETRHGRRARIPRQARTARLRAILGFGTDLGTRKRRASALRPFLWAKTAA